VTSSLLLLGPGASTAAERCRSLLEANAELERQHQRLVDARLALQAELKKFDIK